MERIDKILSHEGFGSRKDIKKLLRTAEVTVNGRQIYDSAFQIDTEKDTVCIDGEELNLHGEIYLMMNKIMHTVCSTTDGDHRTVFDLLDDSYRTPYLLDKLHLVGRLDMDTEGLLIFTTDGSLTHRIISPKNHIDKSYFCVLEHDETDGHRKEIQKLFEEGLEVGADDNDPPFVTEPACVRWPSEEEIKEYTKLSSISETLPKASAASPLNTAILTIHEGKYHQVKRMFAAVGNKIVFLKRISMGSLPLDKNLAPGQYRELRIEEVQKLI